MSEQQPTNREIMQELRDLRQENKELHDQVIVMKESTDKFDKLHSLGRVAVVFLIGLGGVVLFFLEVARNIKQLWH